MIGYESRLFLENAGSIPIYILLAFLTQLIIVVTLLFAKFGKVHNFMKKQKQKFFWAGSHELYLNSYISLAMCVCI